jgi:hypothetical protein
MSYFSKISLADGAQLDAFGRLRVSNPITLFDSKQIHDDPDLASSVENQPLFYDNQETSGGGTTTAFSALTADTTLAVSATTAGVRVRQTKMRFNYQPGKSLQILMTFVMGAGGTGITKREGYFDENNGIFLEYNGTNYGMVRRTGVTGSPIDNRVAQSSWNIDPLNGSGRSGVTLDFTKTQILFIDLEWLGVGRVRTGFVVGGALYYCHEFLNTNVLDKVYMSTPNLPLRSEIVNGGAGAATSMTQICSTVVSEGGLSDLGTYRYASTAGTHLDANTENELYALIGIKLKSAYIGAAVDIESVAVQLHTASSKLEWVLLLNPTVASTFTYTDQLRSSVGIAKGATANTVTGGYAIAGGFVESGSTQSGSAGSASGLIASALRMGSTIAGATDAIVLCVRPIGGTTNADVEGSITWHELS